MLSAARAFLRRMRSITRLRAVVISQPVGLAGMPSCGQRSAADTNASCRRVFGQLDVAEIADERGQNTAPLIAEDLLKHR